MYSLIYKIIGTPGYYLFTLTLDIKDKKGLDFLTAEEIGQEMGGN